MYRRIPDLLGLANCLKGKGDVSLELGELDPAERLYKETLEYYQQLKNWVCIANVHKALGELAMKRERPKDARREFGKAVPLYQKTGNRRGEAYCIKSLAEACKADGDYGEAERKFLHACDLFDSLKIVDQRAACIKHLGDIALLAYGDRATAKQKYLESLPSFREKDDRLGTAYCLNSLGDVESESEPPQCEVAFEYYKEASRLFHETGPLDFEAYTLWRLGKLDAERGEVDLAKEHLNAALFLYQTLANTEGIDRVQDLLAKLARIAIEVFFCYSHKDERLRDLLETHLSNLKRQNIIIGWHDRNIAAGTEWKGHIDEHLESARIILLLVSADFLASDYSYDVEMKRALERHEAGEARVIPIILRPCDWHTAPFGKLQALPTDAKPVTEWSSRDRALYDITKGISKVIAAFMQNPNNV